MNNDLIINDHYYPEGALTIDLRVRERQKRFAIQADEERLEEARRQQRRTRLPFKFLLNILSSLAAG